MTISPWAMLITPMTPKVMARPMAASSRTEPREIPYQAFCTASHRTSRFLIAAIVVVAAFMTAGEVSAGRLERSASASWSPRWRAMSTAASFSSSLPLSPARMTAALASVSARLTRGSCSLASAVSSVGSAFAARDLNTACAASNRVPGSLASSVRPPSAASIAPRSRLLMRTLSRSAGASPAIASPVAAFVSLPVSSLT